MEIRIREIHTHLDKIEIGIQYKRQQARERLKLTFANTDNHFVVKLAKDLGAEGPSPRYGFKKSGDFTGDEVYFKNYRKLKARNGSTLHTWFDPEILGISRSDGGEGWEYRYKAKIRFENTNLKDLVNLLRFFDGCKSKGVSSISHKIQLAEIAIDFYPYLPPKCSSSEHNQIFKDLIQHINSRFLLSDLKRAFYSEHRKDKSTFVVSRQILEWATFYQNERKKGKKGQRPYKQAKVYWKFRPFIRAELTFYRPKLNNEKITTIRDLLGYDLTGLVEPSGSKRPEIRFLVPLPDRFKEAFWKHLEGSRIYKGFTNARLGVGKIFLAEMVVSAMQKYRRKYRPPNFYRDFFEVDVELTGLVLKSLAKAQQEFDRALKKIDEP